MAQNIDVLKYLTKVGKGQMGNQTKYQPSEAMQDNQSKGKAWKAKKQLDQDVAFKSLKSELDLEDVKSLYTFLNKQQHKINKRNVDSDGLPTEAYLDWLDSGASAGLAWASDILKQENILKSLTKEIEVEAIHTPESDKWTEVQVAKSLEPELRQATFLVLEPQDEDYMTTDGHEDWYDEESIRKACRSFNKHSMRANILHMAETNGFEIVESYISPVDIVLNDHFIKKGSWLATIYCEADYIWEGVLDGTFNGLSIQCLAKTEDIE